MYRERIDIYQYYNDNSNNVMIIVMVVMIIMETFTSYFNFLKMIHDFS